MFDAGCLVLRPTENSGKTAGGDLICPRCWKASPSSSRARSSPARPRGMLLADLGRRRRQGRAAGRGRPVPRASRAGSTARTTRPTTATSAASSSTPRTSADAEVFDALIRKRRRLHPELPPGRGRAAGRGRGTPAGAQPAAGVLRHQRLRPDRPGGGPPRLRHGGAGGQRLPEPAGQPRQPARVVGPAIADALTGFYAAYGILGALVERGRTGVGRQRGGLRCWRPCATSTSTPSRTTSPGRGHGAVQPAQRVAVVYAEVRRRQVGGAAHVLAREVLAGPGAAPSSGPTILDDARYATREAASRTRKRLIGLLGGVSHAPRATNGARACRRRTCRTRPCTTPARRWRTRRPGISA